MPKNDDFLLKELIASVQGYVDASYSDGQLDLFKKFITIFYSQAPFKDLIVRNIRDLAGLAWINWELMQTRQADEVKIQLITPDLVEDGWKSKGSVLAVLSQDAPFLVDTIKLQLNKLSIPISVIIHTGGMVVERDEDGRLIDCDFLRRNDIHDSTEAPILFEIQMITDPEIIESVQASVLKVINDVLLAVKDWQLMRHRMDESIKQLDADASCFKPSDIKESKAFLNWLMDDHFIFLGARDYVVTGDDEEQILKLVSGSGLGVLSNEANSKVERKFSELPTKAAKMMRSSDRLLMISKSNTLSSVHRGGYTDYIGIKQFDDHGVLIGERRFIGLYTSAAYHSSPSQIPFLRKKLDAILKRSGLREHSHAEKELISILATLPRDDLIQATVGQLYHISTGILHMQERKQVRLFVREDNYGRFVSCLVYLPREKFTTDILRSMEELLMREFRGIESSFSTHFAVSVLARIDFVIRLNPKVNMRFNLQEIENRLIDNAKSWRDLFYERICEEDFGTESLAIIEKYKSAFPVAYTEKYTPEEAVQDVKKLNLLSDDHPWVVELKILSQAKITKLSFKVFSVRGSTPLSDAVPLIENFGCRVIDEYPGQINFPDSHTVWINEFHLEAERIASQNVIELFQESFLRVWQGDAEDDPFNRLVLLAELSWRQVSLLRAYAKYYRQTGTSFSPYYIADTLVANPTIAKMLVVFFEEKFDPSISSSDRQAERVRIQLFKALDSVSMLDQDRIIRKYISLITSTLRTNFYQTDRSDCSHNYISLKLKTSSIIDMPLPIPKYEIFVYGVDFEGIHLRADKVARGGIRWSDRTQDFRVEVLGLMKAQQVKNSVIVPAGAKGGFVIKASLSGKNRDQVQQLAVNCYQKFICGLLDVVDNIRCGQIVAHSNTVCYDDDDEYLVVAADKGTARFSDIANNIAIDRGFWLGDAFASGGSSGYDHMKMGITAKGAWVSAQRHFIDLGIDIKKAPFTVVGIGDMSGDVFGNGLLMSDNAQLVCAFNHQHIFIDPSPDVKLSYKERKRLFSLSRSSWRDYDPNLISKGGGVFERSQKAIKTSSQIRKLLNIQEKTIDPASLISAILCAPVDMIWNGGVGTFIKSASEANQSVGDIANDSLRVNANTVRAKMICEGGNLGVTQLGRIEYDISGGRINTDFIDNSAGVDCSDHEVNMKILLNDVISEGKLSTQDRDDYLRRLTDNVSTLVLKNNYMQNRSISFASHFQHISFPSFVTYIDSLVERGVIDLELEGLPDREEITYRQKSGLGLTRPELCVLLAYSKIELTNKLHEECKDDDNTLYAYLNHAFPDDMSTKYQVFMHSHPLKKQIIATQLANHLVSDLGITFMNQIQSELDVSSIDVAKAYVAAHQIFSMNEYRENFNSLDGRISASDHYMIALDQFQLMRLVVRWLLSRYGKITNPIDLVNRYQKAVLLFSKSADDFLIGSSSKTFSDRYKELCQLGVDKKVAQILSLSPHLMQVLNMVEVSLDVGCNIDKVSPVYFSVKDYFNLVPLRQSILDFPADDKWLVMTKTTLISHLDLIEQLLTSVILRYDYQGQVVNNDLEQWLSEAGVSLKPWMSRLNEFYSMDDVNVFALSVLIEQLRCISIEEYLKNPGKKDLLK
ncbi:MAG: NAD-glutamate dehydrogenase [Coxiellaceae bacterium]|nr:NAD-glutamate dehydrogenase [Coxiellaceae bacterium]